MHQYVPLPDGEVAEIKFSPGASDVVKYSKQDFVWKQVNHRRIVCAPVTPAYPAQLKVSARPTRKLVGAPWAEVFTRFVWRLGIIFLVLE